MFYSVIRARASDNHAIGGNYPGLPTNDYLLAINGGLCLPMTSFGECWGTLFPEETFHAVRFFRRASGPEGCGRRIAKLGESGNIRGIAPGSSRGQTFAYIPPLLAPRVHFRLYVRGHKLAISIVRMVV